MRGVAWVCAITYIFTLLRTACSETSKEDDALILEHDLGLGSFSHRGKIQLPNARRKEPEILSQVELEDADLETLGNEGKRNHGLYKLRVKGQGDNSTIVTGYADGSRLKDAGLRDIVTVYCDEFGSPMAISIRPRKGIGRDINDVNEFSTILLSQTPNQAPVPDTAGFLNKVREEKIRKEKADKEPKSFFGKYWMYILPAVFLFMMSSANQQQQGT